ncbi:MAG: WD40 repeat domain-containing protein [Planctomycetota bacterium]
MDLKRKLGLPVVLFLAAGGAPRALAQAPGAPAAGAPAEHLRLEPLGSWRLPGGKARALALSPDGRTLASAGELGEVFVWDLTTGTRVRRFDQRDCQVGALAFSPDGALLAALGRELRVWRLATGALEHSCAGGLPYGLGFAADGKRLAFHAGAGVVKVLAVPGFDVVREFAREARKPIRGLAWACDGHRILVGTSDARLWALDLDDGAETLLRDDADPLASGWPPDMRGVWVGRDGRIVTADESGALRIGDRAPLSLGAKAWAFAASPGCARVALAGAGRVLETWDADGAVLAKEELPGAPSALALGAGDLRAVALEDGRILVTGGGREALRLDGHDSEIQSVGFSADRRFVAATGERTTLLVDRGSGRQRLLPPGRRRSVTAGVRGSELLWFEPKALVRYDAARDRELSRRPTGLAGGLWVSPDGRRAVTGWMGLGVELWDLASGQHLHQVKTPFGALVDASFVGEACVLALVEGNHGERGSLLVLDADGETRTLATRDCGFHACARSPDGRWLVSASGGGHPRSPKAWRLHLFDGTTLEREDGADGRALWLRFVDERRFLAHDGEAVVLYDAPSLRALARVDLDGVLHAAYAADRGLLLTSRGALLRLHRVRL